jgi:hypothetical protein
MPVSLPIAYRRDMKRLLALPSSQLGTVAQCGTAVYGFLVLVYRCDSDGSFASIILCRSGIAIEVFKDGRIVPAARKVG